MAYAALACRCLVGVVFAVSAISKLRSATAFRAFSSWLSGLPLPAAHSRAAAATLAVAEVVIVVSLLLPWTARAGLALAAVTLAVFAAGLAAVVRSGVPASCQCFGASGRQVGVRHVARDTMLCAAATAGAIGTGAATRPAAIVLSLGAGVIASVFALFLDDIAALFAVHGPQRSAARLASRQTKENIMSYLAAAVLLIGALCCLNLIVTFGIVRRLRLQADHGSQETVRLPPGTLAPEFTTTTISGSARSLGDLTGARSVVAFFAAKCPPCHEQVPAFVAYARSVPGGAAQVLAVVVGGDDPETAQLAGELQGPASVAVERAHGPMQEAFAVLGFPTFYVLDDHGRIQVSAPAMDLIRSAQPA
jgi:thiol-disulfide isomerase/thioredoxin